MTTNYLKCTNIFGQMSNSNPHTHPIDLFPSQSVFICPSRQRSANKVQVNEEVG